MARDSSSREIGDFTVTVIQIREVNKNNEKILGDTSDNWVCAGLKS